MLENALVEQIDTDVIILRSESEKASKAPEMKYRYYAPKGELTIVNGPALHVVKYINDSAVTDEKAGVNLFGKFCSGRIWTGNYE